MRIMPLSAMICSFNKIFSRVRYLFCMRANSIILKASISVGVKRSGRGWIISSSPAGALSSFPFLILSSLLISLDSSLFSSIFISQASLPSLLEEGDDMMPGLDNYDKKQLEIKTKDICVIQWSRPSGDYIMIFYRPKEVSCKKTESGEHTRCPQGRGRTQGVGRALHPRDASCPSRTTSYFPNFLNIPKRRKITIRTILSRFTYRTTYLFLFGV